MTGEITREQKFKSLMKRRKIEGGVLLSFIEACMERFGGRPPAISPQQRRYANALRVLP